MSAETLWQETASSTTVDPKLKVLKTKNATYLVGDTSINKTALVLLSAIEAATTQAPTAPKTKAESPITSCASYHSKEWLDATEDRISNNDEGMDHEYINLLLDPNLLRHVTKLADQTICHPHGNFGTSSLPPTKSWNASDEELVRAWRVKLIYLSIHALLHEPAYEEFRQRKREMERGPPSSCSKLPLFDYECKETKYLVSNIPSAGFGASVRLGVIGVIVAALATNRIPLFVSNTTARSEFLRQPWALSSCSRGDYQCVLHPITPCTIRTSELQNATILEKAAAVRIRSQGEIDPKRTKEKILMVPSGLAMYQYFKSLHIVKHRIHAKASSLISLYSQSTADDLSGTRRQQIEVLTKAAQFILADAPEIRHPEYENIGDFP